MKSVLFLAVGAAVVCMLPFSGETIKGYIAVSLFFTFVRAFDKGKI